MILFKLDKTFSDRPIVNDEEESQETSEEPKTDDKKEK